MQPHNIKPLGNGDTILSTQKLMYGKSRYETVAMTDKMIVSDPDIVRTKKTDSNGRLYLGQDYANSEVRAVIKVLDDNPDDEEESEN